MAPKNKNQFPSTWRAEVWKQGVSRNILLANVLGETPSLPLLVSGGSMWSFVCDCIPPASSSIEKTSQGLPGEEANASHLCVSWKDTWHWIEAPPRQSSMIGFWNPLLNYIWKGSLLNLSSHSQLLWVRMWMYPLGPALQHTIGSLMSLKCCHVIIQTVEISKLL